MDSAELRAQLPLVEDAVYLNSAAGTPCPNQVIDSMTRCLDRHATEAPRNNGLYHSVKSTKDGARDRLASFVNAKSSEIALTQSTADSITRLATSLPLESGDIVVQTDIEHPASRLPFQRIRDLKGIELKTLETTNGQIDLERLYDIAKNAKLLVIDSITWTHGTKLCIKEVADVVHDAGALVLVDAVQSVGQTKINLSEWDADFVVGSGHKWLLGPWGAGFLFVREGPDELLKPPGVSHWSVIDKWESGYRLKTGAQKLEIGGSSPAPYAGLVEAIDLIETIGINTVEANIRELSQYLKQNISSEYLLSPMEFESGIVTIAPPDGQRVAEELANQNIIVRDIPLTEDAIRISLHTFNTMNEVDILARKI